MMQMWLDLLDNIEIFDGLVYQVFVFKWDKS